MSSWPHRHIAPPKPASSAPNIKSRSRSRSNSPALGISSGSSNSSIGSGSIGGGSIGRSKGAGRGGLGLNLHPSKRPVMTYLADPPIQQLQSPTIPRDESIMFHERTRSNTLAIPVATSTVINHTTLKGNYALDPDFERRWEATEMPPLPPIPRIPETQTHAASSFPSRIDRPYADQKVHFPRSSEDAYDSFPRPSDSENDGGNSSDSSRAAGDLAKKTSVVRRRKISALDGQDNAFSRPANRSVTMRHQTAGINGKRNHSLPAALAPPMPSLKLENYEFTSLERLERRWADVKTESTRILSSAIYKYYFNHGEWSEFEQVFPNKVLAVWEDFQNKLSTAEHAFINTILVSQNPFSGAAAEGDREKNIPVLARAIPLTQVVRTMVFGEDMRSRESYSLQTPNTATEIEAEFADWLISRFNSIKASGVTSPTEESTAAAATTSSSEKSSKPTAESSNNKILNGAVESADEKSSERAAASAPSKHPEPKEESYDSPSRFDGEKQRQLPAVPMPPPSQQPVVKRPVSRNVSAKYSIQNNQQQYQQQQQSEYQRPSMQTDKHHRTPASQTHLGLGLNTPPLTAEPSSSTNSSIRSSTTTNHSTNINNHNNNASGGSGSSRPKTASLVDVARSLIGSDRLRRKRTIDKHPAPVAPPESSGRRTTLTVPAAFQPSVQDIAKPKTPSTYGASIGIPPSPPKSTSQALPTPPRPSSSSSRTGTAKSRRHTHNFFSSSGAASLDNMEPRRSTDSVRSSFRMTREIQMKDLPPLPPKAIEIIQGGGKSVADPKSRLLHDGSTGIGKKPGALSHFSSHAELVQRTPESQDKPRSSSLTMDALDKIRGRPSTSASIVTEARSSKSSQSRDSGSTELRLTVVYDWRPVPKDGDSDWGFSVSPLAMRKPTTRKKSTAGHMVVHSHAPTMNRRKLPTPKDNAPPKAAPKAKAPEQPKPPAQEQPKTPAPESQGSGDQMPGAKQSPEKPTEKPKEEPKDADAPPELPKARMPQEQVGLGTTASDSKTVGTAGVRGVLYELAYLSTQGKNVWSKSEHVFANMQKVGLEVNRIAEQDFYDFCVDELLKASNDAYHDLQSLGSKKMAKSLYESFNSNLAVLLSGSGMQ
ncbi:hypothetical protein LPJ72_003761 [Coemansia sp. Benny D160-2]|nr:hypothetical protein LPJ72_003761 [Coemansia sp. Benny D160-2]